jgi:flap endonuclease-1
LAKAREEGNEEEVDKQSRRLVKVGKEHVEDCKELLKLMGIPFVSAPCEV